MNAIEKGGTFVLSREREKWNMYGLIAASRQRSTEAQFLSFIENAGSLGQW
jgi:hypothetical protein